MSTSCTVVNDVKFFGPQTVAYNGTSPEGCGIATHSQYEWGERNGELIGDPWPALSVGQQVELHTDNHWVWSGTVESLLKPGRSFTFRPAGEKVAEPRPPVTDPLNYHLPNISGDAWTGPRRSGSIMHISGQYWRVSREPKSTGASRIYHLTPATERDYERRLVVCRVPRADFAAPGDVMDLPDAGGKMAVREIERSTVRGAGLSSYVYTAVGHRLAPEQVASAERKMQTRKQAALDALDPDRPAWELAIATIPSGYGTRHGSMYGGTVSLGDERMAEPALHTERLTWVRSAQRRQYAPPRPGSLTSGRVMDHSTLDSATMEDGRAIYRVSTSTAYGDDLRETYYMPVDVLSALLAFEVRARGITREMATEWLANYRGCVGTELYEYAETAPAETPGLILDGRS